MVSRAHQGGVMPLIAGQLATEASEAYPGSVMYGRWVITYLGGIQLEPDGKWKELDDDQ